MANNSNLLAPSDTFLRRHLGPSEADIAEMLAYLGLDSLDALTDAALPKDIRHEGGLDLGQPRGEHELLTELKAIASENEIWRSYIGMGYYGTIVPPVIQRNILENPGWYTQYTPYQAEIAQGRLEALLNYQTMCSSLTGMEISNSSLLDEGTAAAEAMTMCLRVNRKNKSRSFFVSEKCFPQTIAVMQTRAKPLEIELIIGDHETFDFAANPVNGVIVQYPDDDGTIVDYKAFAAKAHAANALVVVASDLLALTMLQPPGEWGADIVVGNSQRFGVPFGYGGPHAAFFSCREEYKRQSPGRIVGVSRDSHGMPALRLALQTREQHIRRDKATSNICTAQVLLAIMAGFYGAWHGPDGLKEIAEKVHGKARLLAAGLGKLGFKLAGDTYFDTLKIEVDDAQRTKVLDACNAKRINLRRYDDGALGISMDETVTATDLNDLLSCFGADFDAASLAGNIDTAAPAAFARDSAILPDEVFERYHAEHEMLRYMYRLQSRDLSLTTSMIPLGSCTMKLNATSEMLPVTWAEFGAIHPFVPVEQAKGYGKMLCGLQEMLCEITGFHSVSLQPNSGAQGEYTGMQVIAAYHASRGEQHREICLIPASAHGTNPASAVLAGLKVVGVKCDDHGNIDMTDLEEKAKKHAANLSSIMVTYPSTHGVFESRIRDLCRIIHENGGQVYLDGANLNAQCGICRPGDYGADVCHINLHKTFCIPHGGGGPGMGPIGVAEHLTPFLPGHPVVPIGGEQATGPVSAAPFGSSSILPISWVYINLVGAEGLKKATQVAVLSANYMARRLKDHYPTLYTGETGWVAHEFIAEMRQFKADTKVEVVDIAKRLMDYGFHAPTISFPVPGTMMIEPTESESKEELDRLCDALIQIHGEIGKIKSGEWDMENNPIKNAPHTSHAIVANEWNHPYSRELAAFPGEWNRGHKFWPPVGRIDDVWGDKHLFCSCAGLEAYAEVE